MYVSIHVLRWLFSRQNQRTEERSNQLGSSCKSNRTILPPHLKGKRWCAKLFLIFAQKIPSWLPGLFFPLLMETDWLDRMTKSTARLPWKSKTGQEDPLGLACKCFDFSKKIARSWCQLVQDQKKTWTRSFVLQNKKLLWLWKCKQSMAFI